MKTHRLFARLVDEIAQSLVFTHPLVRDARQDWRDAGEPAVEEERPLSGHQAMGGLLQEHQAKQGGLRKIRDEKRELDAGFYGEQLAAKDARVKQLTEEGEERHRNTVAILHAQEELTKTLEAKLAEAERRALYPMHVQTCAWCSGARNGALEEAAKEAEEELMTGGEIGVRRRAVAARIRALKKP